MQQVTKISLHHTGGTQANPFASTQHHTAQNINDYHRQRWPDFSSSLKDPQGNPWFGGYTLFIERDGKMTQFRAVGEEGAHTIGHNFSAVGICLAGNFGPGSDSPTWMQKAKLKNVLRSLINNNSDGLEVLEGTVLDIKVTNILPHRRFQPSTSCNGTRLSDTWAYDLLREYIDERTRLLITLRNLYQKLIDLMKARQLGGLPSNCLELDNRG